ncbi:hypothetical protein [Clostridium sp. CTA-6]
MRLDSYDEFVEYVVAKFYEEDDIQAICDYELANLLMCEFGNMNYTDYKGVDLQSDVDEYYVTLFGEECFCVEPLKVDNRIKMTTSDYFIIDNNILEKNPTLFNYLEGNNFEVKIIDYDEKCDCNNCCEYCNECEATKADEMDLDELFGGNSIEEEINEEDLVCVFANLIAEYTELILDNDCKEEIIGHALTEFGFKVLEKIYLDEE